MKLCWLLTTFRSNAISARQWLCSSLVSNKHVPACRFQSVSLLHWCDFHVAGVLMVHIIVMSCCSNSCCQTSVKLRATFAFKKSNKSTELLWHKTLDFTPYEWPPNRPDISSVDYRLLRVIHECVYQKQQWTSKHRRWAVIINRMTYYMSQGTVKHQSGKVDNSVAVCCRFTSVSVCQSHQNLMRFDKVIAKINLKMVHFLHHSVVFTYTNR